ncbi:Asl7591 protein [Polaromonas sp. CG9_12]|nr:Asl7591 protein [Polaromonas sp. CG9_12]
MRYSIGLIVMGAIAAYFLLTEHRAHFWGVLPYLLILACPLMHLFMHHGHGHGDSLAHKHDGGQHPDTSASPPPTTGDQR